MNYQRGQGPHFAMVPWDLIDDPRADAYTIAVYTVMKRFADIGRGSTETYVGDKRLAEMTCCSRTKVIEQRKRLRNMGWISWENRQTVETGGKSTNLYLVHTIPVGAELRRACECCGKEYVRPRQATVSLCSRECVRAYEERHDRKAA